MINSLILVAFSIFSQTEMSTREEFFELSSPLDFRPDSNLPTRKYLCRTPGKYIYIILFVILMLLLGIWFLIWSFDTVEKKSRTSTIQPKIDPTSTVSNCNKRVVGYYSRSETSKITSVQVSKLTHAVFAFVYMNSDGTLKFEKQDEEDRFMQLKDIVNMGTSPVKIMISIGGKENSQNFSPVIESEYRRQIFINSILTFLKENDLDGIDLFWEWPCSTYKSVYLHFICELKQQLQTKDKDYILSIVVPPPEVGGWIDGFDMNNIVQIVDFINVFSLDYYGPTQNDFGKITGPTAPMFNGVPGRETFNVDHTSKVLSCETMQSNKFNIAIPFYTTLWENVQGPIDKIEIFRNVNKVHGKIVGQSHMSRMIVQQKGFVLTPYSFDNATRNAFIYNSSTKIYLTFETDQSIVAKIEYVSEHLLGGICIWTVDKDDEGNSQLNAISFDGLCTTGNVPKYDCSYWNGNTLPPTQCNLTMN
ncbi:GH18 domain-containing protein [Caenorhabditis elegans]|nr:GH18 domain-containing protein [Caenorhabditis elegans]CTQ86534.1 GH18 domain-containing protein [Caenorhabditis elegans]|eukprot:NP_001300595.1 CHItinase-Like [Caenorhabditis elegans]